MPMMASYSMMKHKEHLVPGQIVLSFIFLLTVFWSNASSDQFNEEQQGNINSDIAVAEDSEHYTSELIYFDEEIINEGKELFALLCTGCHSAHDQLPRSEFVIRGPGLKGILKEDVLPYSKKEATPETILMQLERSFDKMPSFHFLSDYELICIISYLNTL